ncbi:MAG: alpha/beta hydrolase [Actinomycetota bacterium]|nr:alpha/beta hydrolase [Actinomycetota bacterium]
MATFCLIHGAWHDRSCWEPLVARLRALGHEAAAPELPFHDPEAGLQERVRPALRALDACTGPVVVVGHSMGSRYAQPVALARPGSLLVHLCPRLGQFLSPPGAPDMFRAGIPFPAERPDGTTIWDAQTAIDVLYRRLPAATASDLAQRLRPLAPLTADSPQPRFPDIPTVLVYAAEDEIFEPAWERFMATELLGIEPIEIPGGHFPMLEDPDALASLLDRLALEHARASHPT